MVWSHDLKGGRITQYHMTSHDPVGGHPVLSSGEDSYCSQEFLICYVNVFIDDCRIKEVPIEALNPGRFLSTSDKVIILQTTKHAVSFNSLL